MNKKVDDEDAGIMMGYTQQNSDALRKTKRKRRTKKDATDRNWVCDICQKAYLSQPALNNHKNMKHSIPGEKTEKKTRGRPRKYAPDKMRTEESEMNIFNLFFNSKSRRLKNKEELYNISDVVKLIFDDIFVDNSSKCFNQLMHYTDHPILQMLFNEIPIKVKPKKEKVCDEIFYEYINYVKELTNKNYLILIIKFIVIFREFVNFYYQAKVEESTQKNESSYIKKEFTSFHNSENIPDLFNEFVTEFLVQNDYFGVKSTEDREEFVDLIMHFATWLNKNDFTTLKLNKL